MIKARVIRNKYCDDLFGCQITVPLIHINSALDDDNWPPYVTCRKWTEKNTQQQGHTMVEPLSGIDNAERYRMQRYRSNKNYIINNKVKVK